ncbi:DUF6491 family protein [Hyphococcus sp.]|jgi:hypothetical protein|uniref:DUF6491 family protein n=1 Tax=Hyphococcus sp. TaxID=2038636 RepID=UPI003D0D0DA1
MSIKGLLSSITAAALMTTAACASNQAADEAGADPRIGAKVDRICFGSTINGWKDIKGKDNVVLLERGVNEWYYTELSGACRSNTLRSALSIGIDSMPAGGCVSKGDVIIVKDTPGFTHRCFITGIYEWDDDAPAPEEETDDTM